MQKLKALLARIDGADVGLGLIALGLLLWDTGLALVTVGALLILQMRPFRSWF
jgi:hypothetical protein